MYFEVQAQGNYMDGNIIIKGLGILLWLRREFEYLGTLSRI